MCIHLLRKFGLKTFVIVYQKALINSNNILNNVLTNLLITPTQQNTMGLTGEMEMSVYMLTHRHRVVVH